MELKLVLFPNCSLRGGDEMPHDFHTQKEVEAAYAQGAAEAAEQLENPSILGGLCLEPLGLDSVSDARDAGYNDTMKG